MQKIDVAAYIWPAYTGDEPRTRIFWEEGIGEWQTVKNCLKEKEGGYKWDRSPLWGYVNEADPYVMSMEIEAAVDHGVNVFIYDWYWYESAPFLENCLNDGFLKAPNNKKMKFYLMWANHSVNYTWDIRNSDLPDTRIWSGIVDRKEFEVIGKRWIEKYFVLDNYYRIDNKPVISIYDMKNFIQNFGSVEETRAAVDWLDNEARKHGLDGVHFQYVKINGLAAQITGVDGNVFELDAEVSQKLGFSSITHYQYCHICDINRPYNEIMVDVKKEWEVASSFGDLKYFPHVSIGWDNNPRFKKFRPGITTNNEPEVFKAALEDAKALAEKLNVSLVTINSWNEWTETSYLEPDNVYGYGYLEKVREVFKK